MRELRTPGSVPVTFLSPSSYQVMAACRLRAAFSQGRRRRAPASTSARLGNVCHRVLDQMVSDRSLLAAQWQELLEDVWAAEVEVERQDSAAAGEEERSGPPDRWPDFQLKRARLRKAARRLRDLLAALPAGAEFFPEEPLQAGDGRLRGRADLVVRGAGAHKIIDYKSGAALDRQTLAPRDSYIQQLLLYSFLEAQVTGEWPDTAHLIPLEGSPVDLAPDPASCRAIAERALSLLDAYNSAAPHAQPASPGLETCTVCQHATICPAFWEACDATWAPAMLAVLGLVQDVRSSHLGGISLYLTPERGSLDASLVTVRNISPVRYPKVSDLRRGSTTSIVRLQHEIERDTYRLRESGDVAVLE
jgi:PD-(D/E)XK nuclease superfamily protein